MTTNIIDKLALIEIRKRRLLCTMSKGKENWYLPGGKREASETDQQALIRECDEELGIAIDPQSIEYFGTYQAQAHGKPEGVEVRLTCYTARYTGTLRPQAEVEKFGWLTYADKPKTTPSSHLLLDDLKARDLID